MLIPILHFCGDCADAIALYEKAFNTEVKDIEYRDDHKIAHAEMDIHGQKVFLNDAFGNKDKSLDCAMHLIITFDTIEEFNACYEHLKEGGNIIHPFVERPYAKLTGNFMDKFGVLWGFMVAS